MNVDGIFVEAETSKWELNYEMFIISFITATWTVWQHTDNCCARKYQYFHVKEKLEKHHSKAKCLNQCHTRGQRPEPSAGCSGRLAAQPHTGRDFCENPKAQKLKSLLPKCGQRGTSSWAETSAVRRAGGRCLRTVFYGPAEPSWRVPQGRPAGRDPAGTRHAKRGCSGSGDFTCSRTRTAVPAWNGEYLQWWKCTIFLETASAVCHGRACPSPLSDNGPRCSQR